MRAQGSGYLAGKVGFAAGFIRKGIENTERGRPEAQRVPRGGSGLGFDDGQGTSQEISNGLFVAGLYFKAD